MICWAVLQSTGPSERSWASTATVTSQMLAATVMGTWSVVSLPLSTSTTVTFTRPPVITGAADADAAGTSMAPAATVPTSVRRAIRFTSMCSPRLMGRGRAPPGTAGSPSSATGTPVGLRHDVRGRKAPGGPPIQEEGAVQRRRSSVDHSSGGAEAADASRPGDLHEGHPAASLHANGHLGEVTGMVRRVAGARLHDPHLVEDVVQETLAKLMASRSSLDESALGPYAIVTARNLVTTHWRRDDTSRRHAHRLVDLESPPSPEDGLLLREESEAVAAALARLSDREREGLLAHEVEGRGTAALASEWGSTPGAVAAQLNRARAKLRVEYLLDVNRTAPPTARCRPVLLALSAGEGRRQRELD